MKDLGSWAVCHERPVVCRMWLRRLSLERINLKPAIFTIPDWIAAKELTSNEDTIIGKPYYLTMYVYVYYGDLN